MQYEVMRTYQLGHKFHMATHAGVITSIKDRMDAMAASAELKAHAIALAEALLSIDVGQTQCSVESDKQAILKCVRLAVGRSQFNLAIQGFLADAGLNACGFSGGSGDLTMKLIAPRRWCGRQQQMRAGQQSCTWPQMRAWQRWRK